VSKAKTPNVILLADGARGIAAAQHAVQSWRQFIKPPEVASRGGFVACINIVMQGPTHREYMEAAEDLFQHARLVFKGKTYTIAFVDGDVFAYVPGTDEAKELLA
jgi:hypothetical protein